jgi:PAS domain S-box-containing protein
MINPASDTANVAKTVEDNFEYFFNQASVPFAILSGRDFVFTYANAAYIDLMNGRQLIGKTLDEAIPELRGQPFLALLEKVFDTGVPFHDPEIEVSAIFAGADSLTTKYFNLSYTPYRNKEGIIEGILAFGYDITEQVELKRKERKQILNVQAYNLFMQSHVGFCLARGNNHIVELANEVFLKLTGRNKTIIGKPITRVFPEIEVQGYLGLLNTVLKNKETIYLNDSPAVILKNGVRETLYLNTVLQPYMEGEDVVGVLSILTDVTEQVLARKKVEESEERLRLATEATHLGTWEFLPLAGQLTWSDECRKIYDIPPDKEVDYTLFSQHIYPEDAAFALEAIAGAMNAEGNGSYDIEYRILRYSDKSVRWIRAQGKVYFNRERKAEKFIGTVLDITDNKLKEEILRLNEERLRLAVESGRLGTYELDLINKSIIYSPRLAEIFGINPSMETAHEEFISALHPDDLPIRNEAHRIAQETGRLLYEARVIWPNASIHWIRLMGIVVFNSKKEPLRIYGTVLDITEQKAKEKALKESQKKFELIAETIPHMVWQIELDGRISYINKQWQDWTGLTVEEIREGAWRTIIHPDDLETITNGWSNAFETKNIYVGECRFRNPEGGYSWFTLKTVPVKNDKGDVDVWLGTATDIHQKKLVEQQKDEFISMASHELKTPLTTLKAYEQIVEMMLEQKEDTATLSLIKKMGVQVNKLTTLIGDLLDISKIQHGRLKYNEDFFDFNELLTEVIDDMQRTSATHKINASLEATAKIYGDKNKLSQVIDNLISNAIKYSPGNNNIVVCTKLGKEGVELSVQDFGIGISAHDQKHIFEQFYRVTGESQSTFPGMGIGLYICAEIVASHCGKLKVESVLDKGSTFYMWLPFDHRTVVA